MSWQEILKLSCGTHKLDEEEKALVGNQKKIDANKDGKITAEDFERLRETKKAESSEEIIISTLEKEGGASGLEPLEEAVDMSGEELEELLEEMDNVVQHKSGDYILLDGLPLPEEEEEEE
jgi:hypothetical protein